MSVSFESKIDIDISQSPPALAKFDTATLSANISYNGNSQELSAYGSEITYQWLYSSDGGKTYRSIPSNNAVLSVAVDSKNLNYIYKLHLSVLNPSYKLQSNISNAVFVDSEGNALTTNQYGTPDIVVWYSKDVAVNHAINNSILAPIVDEEIEKNIVSVDLITEDGELLSETPAETTDDLEYSSDNIREDTTIVAMPVLPPISYSALSTSNIAQQNNTNDVIQQLSSVIDCYKPISKTVCGVTFNACRQEIRERTWAEAVGLSPWPPADCVSSSLCKPGCVFGSESIFIRQVVGSWNNYVINNKHYIFSSTVPEIVEAKPVETISCGTPPADQHIIICDRSQVGISNPHPKEKKASKDNRRSDPPCRDFRTIPKEDVVIGTLPTESLLKGLIPIPPPLPLFDACYTSLNNTKTNPCSGPIDEGGGLGGIYNVIIGYKIVAKVEGGYAYERVEYTNSCEFEWKCTDEVYVTSPGVAYTDNAGQPWILYTHSCDKPTVSSLSAPSLQYINTQYGLSLSARAEVDINGNPSGKLVMESVLSLSGKNITPGTTLTFKLQSSASGANYTINTQEFSVTVPSETNGASECDVYQVTMGKDPWGDDCIEDVGPCAVGIPDDRKCYNDERYYSWNSIGTATVTDSECRANCNKAAAQPSANAAILGIKPERSRPIDPGGLLSLSDAEAAIAAAYKDKPYYIQKYKLRKPSFTINPCSYSCKDKQGNWKQQSLPQNVSNEVVADGNKIPYNLCKACGCKQNKDCSGCEVCVAGNCVPPFSPGHPCQDSVNETCCIGYDTDTFDKVVSCANTRKCETCQSSRDPFTTGETAQPTYKTQLKQECCNGIIYDTQCQKCENDTTVVSKCIAPKECIYISEETVVIDYEQYTYSEYECKIPPCPPCQREAPDYNSTGNCINYSDTIEAKSTCKQCEVITDSNGEPAERITSTLIPGQTCCETIPGTQWTPAWVCCTDSTPYYVCSQGTSCCGGECSDDNYCCVGGQKIPKDPCIGCDGEPYCPAGQICCYRSWDKAKGCASPSDCEECNTGFSAFGSVVRQVAALRQNPPDPCKECQNGEVITITSEDPDSPCYVASEIQSIFFIP
jgi:hypothetical protein